MLKDLISCHVTTIATLTILIIIPSNSSYQLKTPGMLMVRMNIDSSEHSLLKNVELLQIQRLQVMLHGSLVS